MPPLFWRSLGLWRPGAWGAPGLAKWFDGELTWGTYILVTSCADGAARFLYYFLQQLFTHTRGNRVQPIIPTLIMIKMDYLTILQFSIYCYLFIRLNEVFKSLSNSFFLGRILEILLYVHTFFLKRLHCWLYSVEVHQEFENLRILLLFKEEF